MNKKEVSNIFDKIRKQNENGIDELYMKCRTMVINIAFSIVKNKDVAEEISQMVFMKIIQLPKEKLPIRNEMSWLYTVTKNQAIEYLRKNHQNYNIDNLYDIEDKDDNISEVINTVTYNRIIDSLEEIEKEIVSLKILSDFSFKEIAQILDIPIGTVQWRYYKAVHTLKILLSNLILFIITTFLYIGTTGKENSIDNYQSHNSTFIGPSSLQGITTDNAISGVKSDFSENIMHNVLLGTSGVFLVITIIFGIIFTKYQQKRYKKTSK